MHGRTPSEGGPTAEENGPSVPLAELARYFLRLGTFGFGGPIALTVAMQRDLVQSRRWITPAEYKEGLALAQLAPGPRPRSLPSTSAGSATV